MISASQQTLDGVWETERDKTARDIQNSIHNTITPTLCRTTMIQDSPVASCS